MIQTKKLERLDVMLDLESLSVRRNGSIIQIAAAPFSIYDNDFNEENIGPFNHFITPSSCVEAGLEIDEGTLKWWFTQDPKIQRQVICEAINSGFDLNYVLSEFSYFLKELENYADKVFVWGYPATSDLTWIQSCYEAAKLPYPIAYNRTRCLGTMADTYWEMTGKKLSEDVTLQITHNALDDCKMQIEMVKKFYRTIKELK